MASASCDRVEARREVTAERRHLCIVVLLTVLVEVSVVNGTRPVKDS